MRLLPRQADNAYAGLPAALWLFGLLLLVRTLMSVNSIFNAEMVATSADGIPLGSFPPGAAATVLAMFGLQAFSRLVFCVLGVVVLIRYRSLIPFMYVLLLLEYLGRRLVLMQLPVPRTGDPPAGVITLSILAATVVGLGLSLWPRRRAAPTS